MLSDLQGKPYSRGYQDAGGRHDSEWHRQPKRVRGVIDIARCASRLHSHRLLAGLDMGTAVVGGDRPASQLVRWTTKDVVADLRYRAALTARSGAYEPGLGRHQPVRPRVYRWHLHVVTDTIVEATATIKYGHGYRAMALRFEQSGENWICTVLNFGPYE